MVAISLYRGNLHRVPSGLRRWPFPRRSLTLNSFKILTRKRALALSRLSLQIKTKDEEKEELAPREDDEELDREGVGENGCHQRHLVPENDSSSPIEIKKEVASTEEPVQEPREVVDVGSLNTEDVVAGGDAVVEGKTEETQKVNIVEDKEHKKKELQEKVHVLSEKKHLLVQMLKQILNTEEEMKRRSVQPSGIWPTTPVPEPAVEMGSAGRLISRINADVNCNGDAGGESEIAKNPNVHSRHLIPTHSTSPSAMSPHSRTTNILFQQSPTPHSRGNITTAIHGQASSNMIGNTAASPSRIISTGHQGHAAAGLPPVSVPGSQFVASSPSPATSGGASSVFRDSRLTSPSWNC
ncbi:uncharacterized protein LOC120254606 [Dioscorea cayenensis subsp. rotundata]|uniref:Uncharacterized protein LOC120254606 n=1 Tax=Dioscorea cayennensis subsp. rotundata TaxID=55577 RepID=A0AB40AUU5_DIOCR|nr:uncharacterized protein LOC120254606 [Dioscorea cayenensis subsp. rotundata]